MRKRTTAAVIFAAAASLAGPSWAGMDEAKKWVDSEFQPSTLSKEDQLKEMDWFIKAATPYKGLEINVLSETIPTHSYESETLTKAFFEITGIKVNHQVLGEGEVVQAVQTQMQTNRNLYDAYINDSVRRVRGDATHPPRRRMPRRATHAVPPFRRRFRSCAHPRCAPCP